MKIESNDNNWVPTEKQAAFLSLPYSVLEAFYAGAVGAGKSDVLLLYPIIHRWYENPQFKGLFLRRTFPELKNEIIPRSRILFQKTGAIFNKNDKIWEWPEFGSMFLFGHCENEEDVHNYDSMQPNYVAFDELTSFTEWQYLYITLQRVRTKKFSKLPAVVRSASNPGNIGHNWVRKRFIDPAPNGHVLIENSAGIKRIFIPATIEDNPYINDEYKKSLLSIPDRAEREAKLYGKWDAYEGQVFDEFRDRHYPDEPENAIHVIEPFDIPAFWPRIFSIDWGYAPPAMTYVLALAISPEGRIIGYRERAYQKTKIAEWGAYIREDVDLENPREIKLCRSGGQDRGQEHTVETEISMALDRAVSLTNNQAGTRISGKALLHEYLRWKPKYVPKQDTRLFDTEKAAYIMRNRGLDEYHAYLQSFIPPEPEKTLPKFQIFSTCKLLINAIKSCVYDKTHPEDVAEFPGDDPYDTVRYGLDACNKYVADSKGDFNKIQQTQQILDMLSKTNDMTAYYRNMRKLDTNQSSGPISRYHHRSRHAHHN